MALLGLIIKLSRFFVGAFAAAVVVMHARRANYIPAASCCKLQHILLKTAHIGQTHLVVSVEMSWLMKKQSLGALRW